MLTPGSLAFARSHHTVTVIDGKAYIFGGQRSGGQLCSTEVHAVSLPSQSNSAASEYACYPALPMKDIQTGETLVPAPRTRHAACARGKYLIVHGGCDATGAPIDESCLWLWDSEHLSWSRVQAASQIGASLAPRFDHHIFVDEEQDVLVLHGGRAGAGHAESAETWMYTFDTLAWTEMPSAPVAPRAVAYADHVLYSITEDPESDVAGAVHFLDIRPNATEREKPDALRWRTVGFPANPLTPGPQPREGGALLPVTTGVGRSYLIYMFGSRAEGGPGLMSPAGEFFSDIWALQLPSHGISGAALKDAIRNTLPRVESGEMSWSEVDILPVEATGHEGKAHPGPRGFFGADVVEGRHVVLWGGVSAKGEEGDGWMLKIESS